MADVVIQRVVFPLDPHVASLYYRLQSDTLPASRVEPQRVDRRSIVLDPGVRLETNTYFNSFFETYWRNHTRVETLVLRLRVRGRGTVRLARVSFFDQANFRAPADSRAVSGGHARPCSATHVLLLDDNALVEPESVFRAATFFSLAREEFAVGGAMLDLMRPTWMYQAGASVRPRNMGVGRRGEDLFARGRSVARPASIRALQCLVVFRVSALGGCPLRFAPPLVHQG